MKKATALVLMVGIFLQPNVFADPWKGENFSVSVALTSDYVSRGISQSDEDAAIQGSIDWGYEGYYAGIWGSSVDLKSVGGTKEGETHSSEYDFYLGYQGDVGRIDYDATLLYYWYPGDRGSNEADSVEFTLDLSHTFKDVLLQPTVGIFSAYSPCAALENGTYTYFKPFASFNLMKNTSIDFGIGFTNVEGDKTTPEGYGFTHYEFGVITVVKGFDIDLRYHNTNNQKSIKSLGDLNDSRVVLSISRTFGS